MSPTLPKPLPSLERLNELLLLDVESGFLFWKIRTPESGHYTEMSCKMFNCRDAGNRADRLYARRPYAVVKIALRTGEEQQAYAAHRIIWKMVNGRDPFPLVDHIDRDKKNNKPGNLREADYRLNVQNRSDHQRRKKEGALIGVYPSRNGKFRSQIWMPTGIVYLGTFPTAEEASAAFLATRELRMRHYETV